MILPTDFERRLAERWPREAWADVTVLVAVSGGADSVAMLHGLAALAGQQRQRLVVGHFHHGLRGADADHDRQFVVDLAGELGLAVELGAGKTAQRADDDGDGVEAAAREMRYAWLLETAHRRGARYVCTAHTADDQAETVLHRVLRGTGLVGLRGIKRARQLGDGVSLIRPLLSLRRSELRDYLASLGQSFREDGSNSDRGLTRNRLRIELLPKLAADYNPQVVEALVRLGTLAGEAQEVIDAQVAAVMAKTLTRAEAGTVQLDVRCLAEQPRYLVREFFSALWHAERWPRQAMGYAEWNKLADLACGSEPIARHMFPGRIVAERNGDLLRIVAE